MTLNGATSKKQWPFPGDLPVVRARKVALAYRQQALDYEAALNELYTLIAMLGPSIIGRTEGGNLHELPEKNDVLSPGVAGLDERFIAWGEKWHTSQPVPYDDDELVDLETASQILVVSAHAILRRIQNGTLVSQFMRRDGDHRKRHYFKAGDIYALQNDFPNRSNSLRARSTDKVGSNGQGGAE
jgi:hypothetical protein